MVLGWFEPACFDEIAEKSTTPCHFSCQCQEPSLISDICCQRQADEPFCHRNRHKGSHSRYASAVRGTTLDTHPLRRCSSILSCASCPASSSGRLPTQRADTTLQLLLRSLAQRAKVCVACSLGFISAVSQTSSALSHIEPLLPFVVSQHLSPTHLVPSFSTGRVTSHGRFHRSHPSQT